MSKRIALKDYIEVDGIDLSNFFSQIGFDSEDAQEDVSGFNSTGASEFLQGIRTQTITGTVYGAYGVNETWDIIYALYRDRTTFVFKTRPDSSLPVSATNPSLQGNAKIYSWGGGATRGQVDSFPVTFRAADSAGFEYVTT